MVVAKNRNNSRYTSGNYIVYGNHAYDLDRYDEQAPVKRESTNKKSREMYKARLIKQFKMITLVAFMFAVGFFIVGRYAMIMNLGNESRIIQNKIASSGKVNEELRLELMKNNDIKQIEKAAATELNMIHPDNSSIVHISGAALNNVASKQESQDKKVSLLDRVAELFN